MLLAACSVSEEVDMVDKRGGESPVQFSIYVSQPAETRAGAIGEVDDAKAQSEGFGVFAFYTDETAWTDDAAITPNFMYNQQVVYGADGWTYSPVKYWPNDFSSAAVDDQDGDTGSNPATGSKNGGRLSFFAYAPYVAEGTGDYGITALTANNETGAPRVTYRLNQDSPFVKDNVDLLWGVWPNESYQAILGYSHATPGLPPTDLTKPTTQEAVKFRFLHALSQLHLLVQGAFDEVTPGTEDVDVETRILVNHIKVTTGAPKEARLNLYNTVANQARWEKVGTVEEAVLTLDVGSATLRADIRNNADITSYLQTASNFDLLPEGVTVAVKPAVEGASVEADADYGLLFIPASKDDPVGVTFQPLNAINVEVDYHVVTRDASLVRNDPQGFSIVHNCINRTLTLPTGTYFEPSKKYTLKMILGMTTVKFDVLEVDDWEVPITLSPLVQEMNVVTRELEF